MLTLNTIIKEIKEIKECNQTKKARTELYGAYTKHIPTL